MPFSPDDSDNHRRRNKSTLTAIVNGPKLHAFRQQIGMTQEQLAEKSGYSDRLIRKAEASGPLRKATIADLATALSVDSQSVTATDLTFSYEVVARQVHELLLTGTSGHATQNLMCRKRAGRKQLPLNDCSAFATLLSQISHPRLTLDVAGKDLQIPFAGRYEGIKSSVEFRARLIQSFGSVQLITDQTKCFTSSDDICIHSVTEIQPAGFSSSPQPSIMVWWFLKARFKANLLHKLELMYDTGNICRLLGKFFR